MEWQDKLFEDLKAAAQADEERGFPAQDRLWAKIEKQLDRKEQRPERIALRRVMYVAASVVILLGLSLTFVFISGETKAPNNEILVVENSRQIGPADRIERQNIVSNATRNEETVIARSKTRSIYQAAAKIKSDTVTQISNDANIVVASGPQLDAAPANEPLPTFKEDRSMTGDPPKVVVQYRSVNGVVLDKSGPVPGAAISIKDGTQTVRADAKGNFTIEIPEHNNELIVSSFGAETKVVALNEKESYMVLLEPDYKGAEVYSSIVNGKDKRGYTRSLNTVIPQSITNRPANSITEVLERATPGLLPTKGIGLPPLASENAVVNQSPIYNNDPLIIVNGAPFLGKFSEINPKDIEKIDILNEAAGRALFGSRAKNGVIQVTLKQGKSIDDMKQIKKRKPPKK